MGTYLKHWMPIKRIGDKRLVTVDSIWSLNGKDLRFKGIEKTSDLKTITVMYDIVDGSTNEIYPIKEGVYLHMNWDDVNFPADHKVVIKSYVNDALEDEESIDTKDAPAY